MQRVVKFRAWDAIEGGWVCESWIKDNAKEVLGWLSGDRPKEITVEQFTGLHDKNGKEIYESDIVEIRFHDMASLIGVITWQEYAAGFTNMVNGKNPYAICFGGSSTEGNYVIGNIHEKKEYVENLPRDDMIKCGDLTGCDNKPRRDNGCYTNSCFKPQPPQADEPSDGDWYERVMEGLLARFCKGPTDEYNRGFDEALAVAMSIVKEVKKKS